MSPSPLSTKRCTTGGSSSRRWIIAALVVALIGLGVPAFADTTAGPAKKVQTMKSAAPRTSDEPVAAPPAVGTTQNDGGRSASSPLAPPSNDDCAGALVIPDGPYPLNTTPVDAIDATPQGVDEGIFPCAVAPNSGTDYTVWYSFTPSVTTLYTFTTCPAAGAVGNTVLDTVIGLFSSTGGSCPAVANLACADSSSCATAGDFSTISSVLQAGTTYFLVAGNWQPGGGLASGNSTYVIHVEQSSAPGNDTCGGAINIPIDRVVQGSSAGANDDYQSPADAACFSGIGQTPSTSPGRDIVFTFTAPANGLYSIRQIPAEVNANLGQNPTLYASSSCPAGGGLVTCLPGGGANRETAASVGTATGINVNRGEEIHCLSMTAGQQIYVFFDNGAAGNDGIVVGLEATACQDEVEPNDTPATATPYSTALCGNNEGASSFGASAHCVLGTNPGGSCIVQTGTANVNSDCGAAADGGLCFYDSVCIGGATPGAACVPTCVGGTNPGAICSGLAGQCTGGGACATNGGCGQCVDGPTPGLACTSAAQCGSGGTCNAGTCDRRANEGDVDFWSLGSLPAGSKVWTAVEATQANDYNFRMRVTDTADTLGFDDDDASSMSGTLSSVIAGAQATGGDTYVRVSRTTGWASAPYRLYANVTGPIASAQAEVGDGWDTTYGWPGDGLFAPYLNNGANTGFVSGVFAAVGDSDCWQMLANEGDDLAFYGDSNPSRVDGNVPGIPQLIIYDAAGASISNFVFTTGVVRSVAPHAPNPGLDGLAPQDTSFFMHWRARYTGAFELCAYPFANTNLPALGPYPKIYAGSITVNCQPPRAAGPGTSTTDVSVTKTGPSSPVPTSSIFQYTITVTNSGADIAQGVNLTDSLPAAVSFLGLAIDDGFGGNNTACLSLPTPGTADAPIDCTNVSMAPGSSTTYTVTVQVNNCIGEVTVDNTASITTVSTDPNTSNDSATWSFTTSANPSCVDLLCDSVGCIESLCTVNDHCEGTTCVSDPKNCDDNSVCTIDSCDIGTGNCINDGTPGSQCDDGNPCTADLCDPVDFCIFPPAAAGVLCDDFFSCTHDDVCDGQGFCAGISVCSDGNACTDDFADENDNCACSYAPTYEGAPCSDGDACTANDACDGANNCVPGAPADCNDNNPCTNDSCDAAVGCVNAPVVCDDGNACTSDSCDPAVGCVFAPISCDDGSACTSDSCDPATGCVNAPVSCDDGNVCTDDGCDAASGCFHLNNTASCDDGNPATGNDTCNGGVCTGTVLCSSTNDPKTKGWYKSLCNNDHSGDSLTDADAACVAGLTATFSGISTVADICAVIQPSSPNNDVCGKEEDELMVLALNICKQRVCPVQGIDSMCGSNSSTVGSSLHEMDLIFSNPSRDSFTCYHGGCLGEEINTGRALELDSVTLSRDATGIRVNWQAMLLNDGTGSPKNYTIWRRIAGSGDPFAKIGTTTSLTFLDTTTGTSSWDYIVRATIN